MPEGLVCAGSSAEGESSAVWREGPAGIVQENEHSPQEWDWESEHFQHKEATKTQGPFKENINVVN